MKDLKTKYMAALRMFESEPTAESAEHVDYFYRQLVGKGVRPWLCTEHAPFWKAPKGCILHAAGCDVTGPYVEWHDIEGNITVNRADNDPWEMI